PPPTSPLFPYTTLFRSDFQLLLSLPQPNHYRRLRVCSLVQFLDAPQNGERLPVVGSGVSDPRSQAQRGLEVVGDDVGSRLNDQTDRKSTRLNSSHVSIS